MFFKTNYINAGVYNFFLTKLRTRLIPYLLFGSMSYIVWLLPILMRKYGVYHGHFPVPESILLSPIFDLICGYMLWFLPCLMITEILTFTIVYISNTLTNTLYLLLASMAILGSIMSLFIPLILPFCTGTALTAVAFYYIGYAVRDKIVSSMHCIAFAICIVVGAFTCYINTEIDMRTMKYGNIFIFYISAFTNIYVWVYIAIRTGKVNDSVILKYIGKNSLIYFAMEGIASFPIHILISVMTGIKVINMSQSIVATCFLILLTSIVLAPTSYIINRYAPLMIGREGHMCRDMKFSI